MQLFSKPSISKPSLEGSFHGLITESLEFDYLCSLKPERALRVWSVFCASAIFSYHRFSASHVRKGKHKKMRSGTFIAMLHYIEMN